MYTIDLQATAKISVNKSRNEIKLNNKKQSVNPKEGSIRGKQSTEQIIFLKNSKMADLNAIIQIITLNINDLNT